MGEIAIPDVSRFYGARRSDRPRNVNEPRDQMQAAHRSVLPSEGRITTYFIYMAVALFFSD